MNNNVDYEILHLPELEEALKNIDEIANPEDATLIKELIAKGGYKYPPATHLESIEIEQSMELASRWDRLWAFIIDTGLASIMVFPTMAYFGIWDVVTEQRGLPIDLLIKMSIYGILLFLLMHGYLLNNYGQTIGKRLMRISIVTLNNEKPNFIPLILKRYLIFRLVPYIPLVGGLLTTINTLFIFRKNKRCVHDLIAGTKVVKISDINLFKAVI